MDYKRGSIIQFTVNRAKYRLTPSSKPNSSIFVGSILKVHKDKLSIKFMDINGDYSTKYITINKRDVIKII